jgi:hypothetical protein
MVRSQQPAEGQAGGQRAPPGLQDGGAEGQPLPAGTLLPASADAVVAAPVPAAGEGQATAAPPAQQRRGRLRASITSNVRLKASRAAAAPSQQPEAPAGGSAGAKDDRPSPAPTGLLPALLLSPSATTAAGAATAAGTESRRVPSRLRPWACPACTFENVTTATKCKVCRTQKAASAGAAAVAAAAAAASQQQVALALALAQGGAGAVDANDGPPGSRSTGGQADKHSRPRPPGTSLNEAPHVASGSLVAAPVSGRGGTGDGPAFKRRKSVPPAPGGGVSHGRGRGNAAARERGAGSAGASSAAAAAAAAGHGRKRSVDGAAPQRQQQALADGGTAAAGAACAPAAKRRRPASAPATGRGPAVNDADDDGGSGPGSAAPAPASEGSSAPSPRDGAMGWPAACAGWVLLGSSLEDADKAVLRRLAHACGGRAVDAFGPAVTHVLCRTDGSRAARRTFKYLQASSLLMSHAPWPMLHL